jgi:NADPH:quinone reductase-like Zn-dependent oxidoreductase
MCKGLIVYAALARDLGLNGGDTTLGTADGSAIGLMAGQIARSHVAEPEYGAAVSRETGSAAKQPTKAAPASIGGR